MKFTTGAKPSSLIDETNKIGRKFLFTFVHYHRILLTTIECDGNEQKWMKICIPILFISSMSDDGFAPVTNFIPNREIIFLYNL